MKKIMLFIMLFMAMAFADDSYFAKVAARDAEAAAERAEKAAMKTLERIDQLTLQVVNLRNDNIVMQKRLEEQIALNQYIISMLNNKSVKDGVAVKGKNKNTSKIQAEADKIVREAKEQYEAEKLQKQAKALAIAIQEWQKCAQEYAVGQCTSTCTKENPGLIIGYETQHEACRVKCENIQKNKCGVKPTAMKEERKSEAKAFGFCLFTKDSKLAIL